MSYKKSEKKAEEFWTRRGLIWRTLAKHEGLSAKQVIEVTGLPRHIVLYDLGITHPHGAMPGIYRDENKRWHAEGVTEEWLEVLL
jgi:hypothetical protein